MNARIGVLALALLLGLILVVTVIVPLFEEVMDAAAPVAGALGG